MIIHKNIGRFKTFLYQFQHDISIPRHILKDNGMMPLYSTTKKIIQPKMKLQLLGDKNEANTVL